MNTLRLLVVDDDADSIYLIRSNLRAMFSEVEIDACQSGREALDLLRKNVYSAIVTDYRMPWMDGLTLVRSIRGMGFEGPIVMRTAMEDLQNAARAAGVDYVLPWFRYRDLGVVLKDLIEKREAATDTK
jgi:CheY-like chemotaxis protein